MRRHLRTLFLTALALLTLTMPDVWAQAAGPLNLNLGADLLSPQRIFQLVSLITILSLAPSILLMVTSFTRIVIVFSFLRSAMGLQNSPPNVVLVSLALFLTAFVMAPVFEVAYNEGIEPYLNQEISEEEAFTNSVAPFRVFMLKNVNEDDLSLFAGMLTDAEQEVMTNNINNAEAAGIEGLERYASIPLKALIPAFMISELRRAFEIGFLLFLPFLIIDLTIASILMSMGMMMLPPVIISLPFKIIFFVLIDGWHILAGSLVESFRV